MPTPEAPDPVEAALDIIRKGLPGFADKVEHVHGAELIRVRGGITFGTMGTLDQVYAVPVDPSFDPDASAARRTEAAEAFARHLVDITRRRVIELIGIEELVAEREERARERGYAEGYEGGRIAGEAKGRHDILAEILAAREEG